ncbi:MAG TPA: hypothetical protein VLC09_14545 [Polyangiaceae bacterium]|nr:hypothetical protein [Polyangiaceae bacterium]
MLRSVRNTMLAAVLLSTLACGGALQYDVRSSSLVPGADAKVTAEQQEATHSTKLTIAAKNLAPAGRVIPDKEHYLIWERPAGDRPWVRIGRLDTDPDTREGVFEGSVPETHFELSITAEADADASEPSSHVVFNQVVGD